MTVVREYGLLYPTRGIPCLASGCVFDTDVEIDDKATLENKLQLMSFHVQLVHTPVPVQPAPAPSAQPRHGQGSET